MARREETRTVLRFWPAPTPGGCPSNIAVGLSRLGVATEVKFVIGDDSDSIWYLKQLASEGVGIQQVIVLPGEAPRSYLFFDDSGLVELFYYPGVTTSPATHPELQGIDWLVITIGPPELTRPYFRAAKTAGIPVAWQMKQDPNSLPDALMVELLSSCQLLFSNQSEVDHLLKMTGLKEPQELLELGPKVVVVTQGARGSEVFSIHGHTYIPCLEAQLVDPTGAGDGYTAGFLYGWLKGLSPQQCGQIGAVVASFVVEEWGCQAGLPRLESLVSRYQLHFGSFPCEAAR